MRLSKTRFQHGLQCHKRLWLDIHSPGLADPYSEATKLRFAQGHRIGELAHSLFPGGVLLEFDYTQGKQAIARTAELIEEGAPAIFEAALVADSVYLHPDVIVRVDDHAYDLYEVKATNRAKPEHITDLAIQAHVMQRNGLEVRKIGVIHLNPGYVYGGGEYDLGKLFEITDRTAEVEAFLPLVPTLLSGMFEMLGGACPECVPLGSRCGVPYECSYLGHCWGALPDYPVQKLTRISPELATALLDAGIQSVPEIPADFPGLTSTQRLVCEVACTGQPKVVGDLARTLATLEFPVRFFDFETFSEALPRFAGSRPWQQVPFQWSCHIWREPGAALEHVGYLHDGPDDPRPGVIASMLAALGDTGSIVAHHASFERGRIEELARDFPGHASELLALLPRLWDTEGVIKRHVHHPGFFGKTSIKNVLPALVPSLSYAELEVSNGEQAGLEYLRILGGTLSEEETRATRADLERYCALDTLAMHEVYRALQAMCSPPG